MTRDSSRERALGREPTGLERLLNLEGGIFVKRPRAGGEFVIEQGWRAQRTARTRDLQPGVLVLRDGGQRGNLDDEDAISQEELIRLNTGRNRLALEYLFTLPSADASRSRIIAAVERADSDDQTMKELSEFFGAEALRRAAQLRPPVDASSIEELAQLLAEVGNHRLGAIEEIIARGHQELAAIQTKIAQSTDAGILRKLRQEEEKMINELRRAVSQKRKLEQEWHEQLREILLLIDLTEQFSK